MMKKRLVVFDLDGTLAAPGQAVSAEAIRILRSLEEDGLRIAISSGKPTFYLCGFARQLGLKEPLLVGENGAVLQVGVKLPPPVFRTSPIPEATRAALVALRQILERSFPDRIWYQPNETALTPFFAHPEDVLPLRELIADFVKPEMLLTVYEHPDCFDIVYSALSKKSGIRLLSDQTGIDPSEMIAVGDWTNDYPMFEAVGTSIGIHLPEPDRASYDVPDLIAALQTIQQIIQQETL